MKLRPWMVVYPTVLLVIGGCAFLKSIGRTAAVAGGGAGGALVGSAAGPVGTVAGAAGGAGVVYAVQENSELREGSLQGDGAREAEQERWKGLTPQEWANKASLASQAANWLATLLKWSVAIGIGWFVFRNRSNFRDLGIIKGLKHAFLGGRK